MTITREAGFGSFLNIRPLSIKIKIEVKKKTRKRTVAELLPSKCLATFVGTFESAIVVHCFRVEPILGNRGKIALFIF